MSHVCDHSKKFWFGKKGHVDYCDVMLHAVLVVGLNIGLRFDEVNNLKIGHVTVHPSVTWTGRMEMSLTEDIRNSAVQRDSKIKEWPSNTDMRKSVFMDPFVAMLSVDVRKRKY